MQDDSDGESRRAGCYVLSSRDTRAFLSAGCAVAAALAGGANRQELAVQRVAKGPVMKKWEIVHAYENSGHGGLRAACLLLLRAAAVCACVPAACRVPACCLLCAC
jgi:hypothetical protein